MLTCCNGSFEPLFFRTLNFENPYYRRLEYGECPHCGKNIFRDLIQFSNGEEKVKAFYNKQAVQHYHKWLDRVNSYKPCSFANQNVYYGDFQRTQKKDENGIVIYKQIRKNLNGQSEFLNFVKTRVCYGQ